MNTKHADATSPRTPQEAVAFLLGGLDQYFQSTRPAADAIRVIREWLDATPSETATPYAYEYVDKEGVETFTFQPPDRLKDAHEYKCTPLYKAPVSATVANIPCQLCGVAEGEKCKLTDSVHQEKHPACPANRPDDKNGAPRRGDGLKLYASIFREFFPNHQGEIELSAAVLEEMAERISLAWTTPSATLAPDKDGERYRWLKENYHKGSYRFFVVPSSMWDQIVDAAMRDQYVGGKS